MQNIQPVILCGGTGSRLWPLSRQAMPKQFLPLMGEQTMLQATIARLSGIAQHLTNPIYVCNEGHRFLVAQQAGECHIPPATIILEPEARNTAPAVAVSAFEATRNGDDPLLLVLPADHVIDDANAFVSAAELAAQGAEMGALMTFGVVPTHAETGYGYISVGEALERERVGGGPVDTALCRVSRFVEKPDQETAERYLSSGTYLWNSGMFLFRASRYLEELAALEPDMFEACKAAHEQGERSRDFLHLCETAFAAAPENSIDYAVMERTDAAAVVALDAGWNDVGSWSALHDAEQADERGNVVDGDVMLEDVSGSYVRADHRMVAAVGVQDQIIVETEDAVLVAARDRAQDVKRIVARLREARRGEADVHARVHRPWGTYETVDLGERHQVKRITVLPGASLSLQMHHHRAEHWIVVKGTGKVTRGDETFLLSENQSTFIPIGETHRLENPGTIPLELIEVQSGSYLGEDDIVRFQDTYGRTN